MQNKEKKHLSKGKKGLLTGLAVVFWIGVWWIAALYINKSWVLPTPWTAFSSLLTGIRQQFLFRAVLSSLCEVFKGYISAIVFGVLLAALTARSEIMHILFSPILTVIKATPIASFILILWVMVARNSVPAISVMLIVLPIVWANTEAGFAATDKGLSEMADCYGFSFFKKLWYIYLPSLYPYFKTAALTAMGMAWKAGIAAEVLCTPQGTVGTLIQHAKRDMQSADLFAWTFAVVAVCFAIEKALGLLLCLPYKRRKR